MREIKFKPINLCIYGPSHAGPLTDEHIVPLSLGGELVLPQATCTDCQKITCKITDTVARKIYGRFRRRVNAPTRSKKSPSETLLVHAVKPNGSFREVQIPAALYPRNFPVFFFEEPEIVTGKYPETWKMTPHATQADMEELFHRGYIRPKEQLQMREHLQAGEFCRQAAQIAHAFAAATVGLDGYDALLPPLILRRSDRYFELIGSVPQSQKIDGAITIELIEIRSAWYLSCKFTLPLMGPTFPTYRAVIGKVQGGNELAAIQARIVEHNASDLLRDFRPPTQPAF